MESESLSIAEVNILLYGNNTEKILHVHNSRILPKFTIVFFKKIYLFLERGGVGEKERERNIHVWLHLA